MLKFNCVVFPHRSREPFSWTICIFGSISFRFSRVMSLALPIPLCSTTPPLTALVVDKNREGSWHRIWRMELRILPR